MSVPPPAARPTMMRTGRAGQVCAQTTRETTRGAATPAARRRNCRRGSFTSVLPGLRATIGFPQSIRFDVGHPDHLAPFPGLVGNELGEIHGRAGERGDA